MTCNGCRALIERSLRGVSGVRHVDVDLESKLVMVQGSAAVEQLAAALEAQGKRAVVVPREDRDARARPAALQPSAQMPPASAYAEHVDGNSDTSDVELIPKFAA